MQQFERVTSRCVVPAPPAAPLASPFDIVLIGASAGGIPALKSLVAALAPSFPTPIVVCQHVNRSAPSLLPAILSYRSSLRVAAARQGDVPAPGSVYVAPPNRHLLLEPDGSLGLSDAERVNYCRPSIDVLFHSAASVLGARAAAVILTGYGRDGAAGVRAIQRCGGLAVAQDEASSEVFDMPRAARDLGGADLVLPLHQIATALEMLVRPAPMRDAPSPSAPARARA